MQRNLFGLGGQPRKRLFARAIAKLRGETAMLGLTPDVDTSYMPVTPAPLLTERGERTKTKKGLATLASLAVAGGLVVGAGAVAGAVYSGPGMEIHPGGPGASYGTIWLGALEQWDGSGIEDLMWCLQGRIMSPGVGDVPTGSSILPNRELAYLLGTEQGVETDISRAALGLLVHLQEEVPGTVANGDVEEAKRLYLQGTPQEVVDYAEALMVKAKANAGPYVETSPTVTTETGRTGSVQNLGVRSDAGVIQAGLPFTLTLTGPAIWDATGTNVLTGVTEADLMSFTWTATGNGRVSSKMVTRGLIRTTLTKFDFAGNRQDVLTYGNRPGGFDPTEIDGTTIEWDAVLDFDAEIGTQVASTFVQKGAPFVDVVTASAAAGQTWAQVNGVYVPLTAKGTLYGPFASQPAQSAAVPAGAPVVGTETLVFEGPGTMNSPGTLKAPGGGYFTWVWEFRKADQPADSATYLRTDFADHFGRVAETSITPFGVEIATQVTTRFVEPGTPFLDQVSVSPRAGDLWLTHADGTPVELTAKGTLFGPFATEPLQSATAPEGAPIVGTETLVFSSAGTKTSSGNVVATQSGYYTWVWEIVRNQQPVKSQPYIVGDFRDAFGLVPETQIVPFQPQATTQRSDRVIGEDEPLIDGVTAFAAPGDLWLSSSSGDQVPVTFTGTAYGPFSSPLAEDAAVPPGAPVAGTETLTFNGPGTQNTSGSVRTTGAGFYTWVWKMSKADQPSANQPFIKGDWTDNFMIQQETSVVLAQIKHRSQTREYNVVPLGRAFDTIWLEGMPADHGSFEGLGEWMPDVKTATVRVYGPLAEAPTTVEVPEGTPIFWETEIEAKNGVFQIGYDDLDPISPSEGGHYVFVLHFGGDDRVAAFSSPFNDLLERFYVPTTPEVELPVQVVTQATTTAAIGELFGDTALVVGTPLPGDEIVFDAIGPQDAGAEGPDTSVAPFFTSERIPVTGPGYYFSGLTSVDTHGKVYWRETYYRNGEIYSQSEYGVASEITLVVPSPLSVITKSSGAVTNGEPSWDAAYFGGDVTKPLNLVFELYKTDAALPICDVPVWKSEYGQVTEPGEYKSEETVLAEDGHYEFVHVVTDEDGVEVSRGQCGAPGEGVDVLPVTPEPTPEPTPTPEETPTPTPTPEETPTPEPTTPPAVEKAGPPILAATGADGAVLLAAFAGTFVAAGGGVLIANKRRRRRAEVVGADV